MKGYSSGEGVKNKRIGAGQKPTTTYQTYGKRPSAAKTRVSGSAPSAAKYGPRKGKHVNYGR